MLSVLNQYTQNYQIYGLAELASFNYCISPVADPRISKPGGAVPVR